VSIERMSHLSARTISEVAPAWREQSFSPLAKAGLRSVQRINGLSAPINLCTVPASGRTSDFDRRVGQLTIGCARTEAADRLGRPGAQSSLPVDRLTETVQMRAQARSKPPLGCRWDLLPMLSSSAGYPSYFSSPIWVRRHSERARCDC